MLLMASQRNIRFNIYMEQRIGLLRSGIHFGLYGFALIFFIKHVFREEVDKSPRA